jgi:enamine deaminase RidA (YjgF/YER057c/UK114 family)
MNWNSTSLYSGLQQHGQPEGYHYDVARRAGPLLFLTGIAAVVAEDDNRVIKTYAELPDEIAAQFRTGHLGVDWKEEAIIAQAWTSWNTIKTLLAEQGAGLEDILYVTTYLKDTALFPGLTQVRTHFFPEVYPPGALVESGLLHPDVLVEIAIIAAIPDVTA